MSTINLMDELSRAREVRVVWVHLRAHLPVRHAERESAHGYCRGSHFRDTGSVSILAVQFWLYLETDSVAASLRLLQVLGSVDQGALVTNALSVLLQVSPVHAPHAEWLLNDTVWQARAQRAERASTFYSAWLQTHASAVTYVRCICCCHRTRTPLLALA